MSAQYKEINHFMLIVCLDYSSLFVVIFLSWEHIFLINNIQEIEVKMINEAIQQDHILARKYEN